MEAIIVLQFGPASSQRQSQSTVTLAPILSRDSAS